jgi:tetratricopeptide (TPR) repeat protein
LESTTIRVSLQGDDQEEGTYFMQTKSLGRVFAIAMLVCPLTLLCGQNPTEPNDYRALVKAGNEALTQNRLAEAARAFQQALDLNPSSVGAHEGLGVALFRELAAGNVRTSAYSDMAERAEAHLTQASELSPSTPAPLLDLSDLEAFLAEHSSDVDERAERYKKARDALKQVSSLEPSDLKVCLRLASLEHDEFGPALQQAKARFAKTAGPIPDADLRHSLRQQYAALINDAISNAQRASEMNGSAQAPLLLLSRLFRVRALIRNTQEQYAADMQTAEDWQRQFLTVGGHIADTKARSH